METIEVIFGELPPSKSAGRGGSHQWRHVAEQLRARPGEWANIGTHSRSFTSNRPLYLRGKEFQMTTRDGEAMRATIWARYVGEAE